MSYVIVRYHPSRKHGAICSPPVSKTMAQRMLKMSKETDLKYNLGNIYRMIPISAVSCDIEDPYMHVRN